MKNFKILIKFKNKDNMCIKIETFDEIRFWFEEIKEKLCSQELKYEFINIESELFSIDQILNISYVRFDLLSGNFKIITQNDFYDITDFLYYKNYCAKIYYENDLYYGDIEEMQLTTFKCTTLIEAQKAFEKIIDIYENQ